ncbi:hypothetical protein WJX79_009403 [Trebouxia sp. C0005]
MKKFLVVALLALTYSQLCQGATTKAVQASSPNPLLNNCNGLVLSEYAQCGGESNCPSGVTCSDSQWPIGCCPTGDSCTRSSASYWQCLPGTPSPPPPEVAAGAYLSGKTALFPDSEGGLTGFTPLDPVLPSQNWTVTGTGQPSDCYYDTDDCEGADASTWQTIWKVTYPDNPSTSVTLCVCSTASFTPNELAHYVGKVPVFLRTTVSAYNAVSGGGTAYTIGVQAYKAMVAATLAAAPAATPAATSAATPAATVVATPSATPYCNGTLQGSGNKLQCIPATPAATAAATPATTVKATPAATSAATVKATPAATSAATVKATPAATSAATVKATPAATTATQTCSTSLGQYAQCGGQSNCPSASMCGDMQWTGGCCPANYGCVRATNWYWQCLPN